MSQHRFAAITASLLARKGEAQPWAEPGKKPLAWDSQAALPPLEPSRMVAPAPPVREKQPAPAPVHAPHARDLKKISVRMTHHDYERLGILAVKQDKTRQRLLQEAVDRLISGIVQKFGSGCACIGTEQCPSPPQTG